MGQLSMDVYIKLLKKKALSKSYEMSFVKQEVITVNMQ